MNVRPKPTYKALLSGLARNMMQEIKYNKTDLFLDIGRYGTEVHIFEKLFFENIYFSAISTYVEEKASFIVLHFSPYNTFNSL